MMNRFLQSLACMLALIAAGGVVGGSQPLVHLEPDGSRGTLLRWKWMDPEAVEWRLWGLSGQDPARLLCQGEWTWDPMQGGQPWSEWRDPVEPGAVEAVYLLEWAGGDGVPRCHGPFRSTPPSLPPPKRVRKPVVTVTREAGLGKGGDFQPGPSAFLTLLTPVGGFHRIRAADVSGVLGVTEAEVREWVRSGKLQARLGGVPLAWMSDGDGDGAWLYLPRVESTYHRGGVVQLVGLAAPEFPERGAMPSAGQPGDPSGWMDRRHERDLVAVPTAPGEVDEEFWFWLNLAPGHPVLGRRVLEFGLGRPSPSGNPVQIGIDCVSTSTARHRMRVWVNGREVGDFEWFGRERQRIDVEVPVDVVREGANELVLESLGDRTSLVYLDRFETHSLEELTAREGGVEFTTWRDGVISVGGWALPGAECWDVTLPFEPVRLTGIRWLEREAGWTGEVDSDSGRRLAWFHPGEARAFAAARWVQGGDIEAWVDGARHVVVAPADFSAAAGGLVAWREGAGTSSRFIPLEAVYDHFSHGRPDPRALLGFVAAMEEWGTAPEYLVLVGTGNYDFRNVLGLGGNPMPPLLAMTPVGRFPADTLLAGRGADRDWRLAVGRIPAASPATFPGWLEKLRRSEGTALEAPARYLLMAGQPDAAGQFIADSEVLRGLIPSMHPVATLYDTTGNIDAMRAGIGPALQSGPLIWNYAGHGSRDRLGNGYLLSADVPGLPVTGTPPVLTALTCGAGHFGVPGFGSIAGDLLMRDQGGVMAAWSPSGFSQNASARLLNQSLFRVLADAGSEATIGGVVLEAVANYRSSRGDPDLPRLYNVLGDPAMPLRLRPADAGSRPHLAIESIGPGTIRLHWSGGVPPFRLEWTDRLDPASWVLLRETMDRNVELEHTGPVRFFRIQQAE